MKAQVIALGNLGSDAKLHTFANGRHVVSFSLATNSYFVDTSGNRVTKTHWYACKRYISSDPEKLLGLLTKGTRVLISGNLMPEMWESKNKEKHLTYYIEVSEIDLS